MSGGCVRDGCEWGCVVDVRGSVRGSVRGGCEWWMCGGCEG